MVEVSPAPTSALTGRMLLVALVSATSGLPAERTPSGLRRGRFRPGDVGR